MLTRTLVIVAVAVIAIGAHSAFAQTASTKIGLSVDRNNRQAVTDFYNSVYLPAFSVPVGWTGNIQGCVPGVTSSQYQQATLDVINFYRAMTGLPGDITLDTTQNNKAQQAALMMIAEGRTDHLPPTNFACYSADGAEAAISSNLAVDFAGPRAIDSYINDFGPANQAAGHRRGILYPPLKTMGIGSTDGVNGSLQGSNALWTVNNYFEARPANGPDWVAFPAPGYVPYQLVFIPDFAGFGANRWSLSRNIAEADFPLDSVSVDFSSATVTMTRAGQNIPLTVVSRTDRFADATIVWEPVMDSFVAGSTDQIYTVAANNVLVNGVAESYSYEVILFDTGVMAPPIYEDGFEAIP